MSNSQEKQTPKKAVPKAASEPKPKVEKVVEPPVTPPPPQQPPQPPPQQPPQGAQQSCCGTSSSRSWAMACHLASFTVFLGIPFSNIFGPMIIWLIKRDSLPDVDAHGKESMNFQLSMTIYYLISVLFCFIFVGFLFLPVLLVLHIIFVIQATVAADKGEFYSYPMTIRFIS